MREGSTIDRVCAVVSALQKHPRGLTVDQLCRVAGVSKRSIYRYLPSIICRFPVDSTRENDCTYYRMMGS